MHKIDCQRRQLIIFLLREAVFESDILALNKAGLL
jgi:hypothetical protein